MTNPIDTKHAVNNIHGASVVIYGRDFKILKKLQRLKDMKTRDELCLDMGIARSTMYDALKRLEIKFLVERYCLATIGAGRPPTYWRPLV